MNPGRLNPILATDSASSTIAGWMFNSLVIYDENGSIKPELARSYRFLDDTTLEFSLRDDVKWSDGQPFSADDVVFTYETITSPKIFTPYSDGFRKVQSVKAKDSKTVVVKYKEPYFKAVETWMTSILPKHILEKEKDLMTSRFNFAPIGTGAYTLGTFEASRDIELAANKEYFLHKPNIDKIVYHFLPDKSTEFLMLRTGKLDIGSLSALQLERQLPKEITQKYKIVEKPDDSYTYLGFNLRLKKFQNPKVREALSLAVNRQELVDILFFGHGRVCTGPFMPGSFAFDESVPTPIYDIQKAKKLLKESGYDELHPLTFEVSTNSANPTRMYAAQILQAQLLKAGVHVKIKAMEWQAFLNTVVEPRNFEAVLLGWGMPLMPDAYSVWHSESARKKGGFNMIKYENKSVDTLIEQAERTVDKAKLEKIYKDIFRLIANDRPYLFLFIPNSITAVNKKINPIVPSIIGIFHNQIDWIKEE